MDCETRLLQQFRRELMPYVAFVLRTTYSTDVVVSPVVGGKVVVTIVWKDGPPFVRMFSLASICTTDGQRRRLVGSPCQRARVLARDALNMRLNREKNT